MTAERRIAIRDQHGSKLVVHHSAENEVHVTVDVSVGFAWVELDEVDRRRLYEFLVAV